MTKDENVVDLELSYDFLVLNMKQYNKGTEFKSRFWTFNGRAAYCSQKPEELIQD